MNSQNLRSERGASPASVLILLTLVIMMAELIVMGGRVAAANADVAAAARESARQGSLAAGPGSFVGIAQNTAQNNLQNRGRTCLPGTPPSTAGSNFVTDGQVTVKVICKVDLTDLSLLNLPWPSIDVVAEHSEIIETYRVIGP